MIHKNICSSCYLAEPMQTETVSVRNVKANMFESK